MHLPITIPSGTCNANHNSKITAISCFIGRSIAPPNLSNENSECRLSVPDDGTEAAWHRVHWVKSRHLQCTTLCPVYPRKRTYAVQNAMSAKGQKRTLACDDGDYSTQGDTPTFKGRSRRFSAASTNAREFPIQPDRTSSVKLVIDEQELRIESRADRIDRANDHHRNTGSDQTVFNRGRP